MLGIGGSVSTNKGGVRGEVVVVDSFDDLERNKKNVRGKIVLYNVPFTTYGETSKNIDMMVQLGLQNMVLIASLN